MKRTSAFLFRVAVLSLLPLAAAEACGPDFFPDVFVRANRPDLPAQFARGRLGILQTGFARPDFFVAYRYLSGGSLDAREAEGWQPTLSVAEEDYGGPRPPNQAAAEAPTPLALWVEARKQYPGAPSEAIDQSRSLKSKEKQGGEYETSFLNCQDDSFRTATATLKSRAALWGRESAGLADWLHAQDAVFANCSGGSVLPAAAPQGSPALLLQDRAYQTAAARFYSGDYSGAAASFQAIANDKGSPWQPSAGYLAARTLVRQAFFARGSFDSNGEQGYDPVLMTSAGKQLRQYLAGSPPDSWRRAAEAQLALVRLRTEPEQRLRELTALVGGVGRGGTGSAGMGSGPGHDGNYQQDVQDLLWLMNRGTPDGLRAQAETWGTVPDAAHPGQTRAPTAAEAEAAAEAKRAAAWNGSGAERSRSDLVDWTLTLTSLASAAPGHALDRWRATGSLPWLVAALMRQPDGAAAPPDLLAAAAQVPVGSPAGQTVAYHRARLLLGGGRADEARPVLNGFAASLQTLPASDRQPSSVNAVRGLSMLAAATVEQFLHETPRTVLLKASEEAYSVTECLEAMQNPNRHYGCVEAAPEQMDDDAAAVFNGQAPLSVWLQAARSSSLTPQLREALAAEGWTRAVLLKDEQGAREFLPLLPPALWQQAGAADPLAVPMTLARNPGLRPYLNGGTQRAYSYDFVESFRDNWCYRDDGNPSYPLQRLPSSGASAAFLAAAERRAGSAEAARLQPVRSLDVGRAIVAAVGADPRTPRADEALYLVLRMIRYGCVEPVPAKPDTYDAGRAWPQESRDLLQLKLDAARLLRRYFAASPWTKKAAPFAG